MVLFHVTLSLHYRNGKVDLGKIYDKADTCQMITTANIQGIMEISGKEGATPLYS